MLRQSRRPIVTRQGSSRRFPTGLFLGIAVLMAFVIGYIYKRSVIGGVPQLAQTAQKPVVANAIPMKVPIQQEANVPPPATFYDEFKAEFFKDMKKCFVCGGTTKMDIEVLDVIHKGNCSYCKEGHRYGNILARAREIIRDPRWSGYVFVIGTVKDGGETPDGPWIVLSGDGLTSITAHLLGQIRIIREIEAGDEVALIAMDVTYKSLGVASGEWQLRGCRVLRVKRRAK